MDRKTLLVLCAILLGCLAAILPYLIYPASIIEREMGILTKSIHPPSVPPLEHQEYWSSKQKYSLGNNLIQVLVTISFAAALGVAFWLYSKKAI